MDNTVILLYYHLGPQARSIQERNSHYGSDHRKYISGNRHQRWNKNLEFHTHRVYRWGIGARHAQAEQHHQKLANSANRGENCFNESTDVAAGIARIPLRNRRGRYCCSSTEALEGDLQVVRDAARQS